MTLGGGEVEAACVTADAGTDVLESVLNKLCDPLGVSEELSCNANAVNPAIGNRLRANVGLHSARANHGNEC